MDKLEVRQITDINQEDLSMMVDWMYNWWGKDEGFLYCEVECFMKHSFQENRLPQTYGLFLNNKLIGMYQFAYEDLNIRPDIYPWLCNVYIDETYRNKGYSKILLETVKMNAINKLSYDELFLYTKHINFYEKIGWTFVSEIDTYSKTPQIQRLYKLSLK